MNYIQKREKKIRQVRVWIYCRWAVALVFVVFAGLFSMGLWVPDAPSEWGTTTLQYGDIKKEYVPFSKYKEVVITGLDGNKYVVQRNQELSLEDLKALLEKGKSYSATYATTPLGVRQIRGLYRGDQAIISLASYVEIWQTQRDRCSVAMWTSLCLGVLSWILIDRLWCRELYRKIRTYKEEIHQRLEKSKKA